MHKGGQPPWHLWGGEETITSAPSQLGLAPKVAGQLVNIEYGRPESWRWVFVTTLLDMPSPAAGIGGVDFISVQVNYNVTIGVGRSQVRMPGFDFHRFVAYAPFGPPSPGAQRRSSVAPQFPRLGAPTTLPPLAQYQDLRDPGYAQTATPAGNLENYIDLIVGQTVLVDCDVISGSSAGFLGSVSRVSAQAFFAPNMHFRPEWFLEDFRGGEEKGR